MCVEVVINKGEKEINTVSEFIDYFGANPDPELDPICFSGCLCHLDLDSFFVVNKINFWVEDGDKYHVTNFERKET